MIIHAPPILPAFFIACRMAGLPEEGMYLLALGQETSCKCVITHVGGDNTLTPDDAVDVLEEVLPAQNHSYVLGLKLKLPLHVVDSIHSPTNPLPRDRLLQVIIAFLQQVQPSPTWRAIVDALRSPAVHLSQLALAIEGKRCVSTLHTHPDRSM